MQPFPVEVASGAARDRLREAPATGSVQVSEPPAAPGSRVDWVDAAKGMSILLVVLYHVVMFLETLGWVPAPVAAGNAAMAAMRMPLFFLASGLFLAGPLAAGWRTLLHKRVAFFLYLYVLWTVLRFTLFATLIPPGVDPTDSADPVALVWALLLPGPYMWFLYALPVFSVVAKLVHRVPAVPVLVAAGVLSALAGADLLSLASRWDYLARLLFFFLLGWHARTLIEEFARATTLLRVFAASAVCVVFAVGAVVLDVQAVLGVVFVCNCVAVVFGILFAGWVSRYRIGRPLVWLGQRTLPVYLIHLLWLAVVVTGLRQLLLGALPVQLGYVLPVVLAGLSLMTHWLLVRVGATWLFALPSRLAYRPDPAR